MTKALILTAALALAGACTEPLDSDDLTAIDTEVAAEIGVCGANMDPITGVECRYGAAEAGGVTGRRAVVETGPDGLDYIVCYIDVSCRQHGEAVNGGHTCQSVIGTGCPDRVVTATERRPYPIPPGSPPPTPEELATYCNYDVIPRVLCDRVPPVSIEQGEDLCCVLREPTTQPSPWPWTVLVP